MKQNRQIKKSIFVLLLLLLTVTTLTLAQNRFYAEVRNGNEDLESKLLQVMKTNPAFEHYFKTTKNPTLAELLKTQRVSTHIDSMVSTAYDTIYQKMKNSFQYDDNGYLSNYLRELYKEGVLVGGESYNIVVRSDGQLKSVTELNFSGGVWKKDSKEIHLYDPSNNEITKITQDWDTTTSNWENDRKYEYTYDANHNRLTQTKSRWKGSAWENYGYKYVWTYDSNNNKTTETKSYWTSGAYKNKYKYEWTYDGNNNNVLEVKFKWNSTTSSWDNYYKYTYTYDGNNNLISGNSFHWNSTTSSWDNSTWTLYTYDANNNKVFENYKQWNSPESSWEDFKRITTAYNVNGKVISSLAEKWDTTESKWENYYKFELSYDADDHIMTYINYESWNGSDWDYKGKFDYRYNSLGMCNGGSYETWFSGHWVSADAPSYMFMPNIFDLFLYGGEPEFSEYDELMFWFTYIAGYEYSVYYEGITGIENNSTTPMVFELSQNYPNPFNPSTVISYQIPNNEFVTLKVYNILGKEVTTLVNETQTSGMYKVNFNASNLTSGIYFYQITAGNFTEVHKMMLLK